MRMRNSDLILYSIHILKEKNQDNYLFTKDNISSTLNIKYSSLNAYLSKLVNEERIIRKKKHFVKEYATTIEITNLGYNSLNEISFELNDCVFTPERHQIKSCVRLIDLMDNLRNPLEKIFLLSLYVRKFSFNLNEYLNNIQTVKNDSNIIGFFKELEKESKEVTLKPFNIDIFNLSLYGDLNLDISTLSKNIVTSPINSYLIHAETQRKQGNLEYASNLYEMILSNKHHINQNQWFIANLGIAQVYRRKGMLEEAFCHLDNIKSETNNKLYHALIKYSYGIYKSKIDKFNEAIKLLSSSIKSFLNLKNPLFISISHTSRGVVFFRLGKYELAKKDWHIAKKYASIAKSEYAKAWVLLNIADLEIYKGNLDKAKKMIKNSKNIFISKGDDEGIAISEFNLALLSIANNNEMEAINHMRACLSINPNIPCPNERRIFIAEFIKRSEKKGFNVSEYFKYGLKKDNNSKYV